MTNVIAHPIEHGWVSKGSTGSPNYDEFASDTEVAAAIQARPSSVLSAEMPHLTPEGLAHHHTLDQALASARRTWDALCDAHMSQVDDVVGVYRIRSGASQGMADDADDALGAWGVFCMVDTAEISSSPTEPGRVIRNEDVFAYKVAQRVALAKSLEAALSPVLLLATETETSSQLTQPPLRILLSSTAETLGDPTASDVDENGVEHSVWLLGDSPIREQILTLASTGELIVADGNHRSLAAQEAGLHRFLAVITTPDSVRIAPYNRLVTEFPPDLDFDGLLARLRQAGCTTAESADSPGTPPRGSVTLYARDRAVRVQLPPASGAAVERLDHSIVEKFLFRQALGMEPGDKRITYVGGNYSPEWLKQQVDSEAAVLAVLIAPVEVADFVEVNLDRAQMPRKSTWFTPKARAGLLCARLSRPEPISS